MSENNEPDAVIRIGVPICAEHLPVILAQVAAPLLQANILLGQPLFSLCYLSESNESELGLPPQLMGSRPQPESPLDLWLCPVATDPAEPPVGGTQAATSLAGARPWPLPLAKPGDALQSALQLIEYYEDDELAQRVAQALGQTYQADDAPDDRALPPRLQQALALMADHLEDPLSTEQIAQHTHLSRRHLERLFRRHLDTVPARYYLQLRLQRAKELLCNTQSSIIQIGLACGFSSGPHFSSAYKNHFQITPRDERQNALS